MSKNQAVRTIKAELHKLNREIDWKIIKGIPYRSESLRHKFLTAQLARLTPKKSWFGMSLKFASMFMF